MKMDFRKKEKFGVTTDAPNCLRSNNNRLDKRFSTNPKRLRVMAHSHVLSSKQIVSMSVFIKNKIQPQTENLHS